MSAPEPIIPSPPSDKPGCDAAFFELMLENNIGRIYSGRVPNTETGYLWTDTPVVVKSGEMVNHPRHYNGHPSGVECIEIMEHMTCNLGNAFKYGWRYQDKGDPVENLEKMLWYVDRSSTHDSKHLFTDDYGVFFRMEVMTPRRRAVFQRPSIWSECVRHSLSALCDMHSGVGIQERLRLDAKIRRCITQEIADLRDAA